MTRWNVLLRSALVLTLVWTCVWGVRAFAASHKNTAERIAHIIANAEFADWSERADAPDGPEAQRRDAQLQAIAERVNRLDFQQREAFRRERSDAVLFEKLSPQEKSRYVDLTVMESFRRFMKSLDGMPPQQRTKFIAQGLREFAESSSEEEVTRARALGADMLTNTSAAAMRSYLGGSSADEKLDLAPLIEVVNETMQGMRGNGFRPREQP